MKATLKSIILTVVTLSIVAIPFTVIAQDVDQYPGYPKYAQFPTTDGFDHLLPSGDQTHTDLYPGYPQYANFPAPEWAGSETKISSNENQSIDMWPGYPGYAKFECINSAEAWAGC